MEELGVIQLALKLRTRAFARIHEGVLQ